jgi:uncharacterized protein
VKIAGGYAVPAPKDRAFALLQNPTVLAKCIPGCEALEKIGEDEYAMKMKVSIASTSGLFDSKVRIADSEPPERFRLIVEGSGKIGFVKGEGLLMLIASDTGTDVHYDGEVHVGGTIASVGQRLIDTTSKLLIKRFFSKLADEVATAASNESSAVN